jgi:aminopeptidase N
MLHLLQNEVMGRERFDYAFREYIRAWAFKHPTPADFFRVMSDAGGMDLDWFWRGWIYTTARLDQAVDSVTVAGAEAEGGAGARVHLSSRGEMLMPLEMRLGFQGGQSEVVRLPVEMWNLGRTFVYRVPANRTVVSVELDPRKVMPDVRRENDVWRR